VRFIDTSGASGLPAKWVAIETSRNAALSKLKPAPAQDYVRKHDGWSELKSWLAVFSDGKCWYCDSRSLRALLEVDHFRPKLAVSVDGTFLAMHLGYWWLAYEWRNFRLSCQMCNRPSTSASGLPAGKRNEFPIRNENYRTSIPYASIANEEPRFLDPCVADDVALLAHCLDGSVRPQAEEPTWDWERAKYTIDKLHLNDDLLAECKRSRWDEVKQLIEMERYGYPRTSLIDRIKKELEPRTEYSLFMRSAIATYRDLDWIEALL
jgi:uncharacterized protein (TIGR02646 family)